MGWWKRRDTRSTTTARRPVSGPDPLGAALAEAAAGGPLVSRFEDDDLVLEDLREWVEVRDAEGPEDFDTVVLLADEIASWTDAADDGLDAALADQPGIDDVFAEDREVVYLRTSLARVDVHAAVVRAIVEVNRTPRPPDPPADEVTDEQAHALADDVAPVLVAAGFVRRTGDARERSYFRRVGEDGFVQAASVARGLGTLSDGTSLHGTVQLHFGVRVPETARYPLSSNLEYFAVGHCTLSSGLNVAPTPAAILTAMSAEVLPWLDATRSRAALAAWVAADPERIFPPAERPRYARLFAEWGRPAAARALLDDLHRHWRRIATYPDAVEARRLLG